MRKATPKNMPKIITNMHVSNLLKRSWAAQVPLVSRVFETAALGAIQIMCDTFLVDF